eukprot:scaffold82613_cov33-Tisochrysis_lutea.AAC.3
MSETVLADRLRPVLWLPPLPSVPTPNPEVPSASSLSAAGSLTRASSPADGHVQGERAERGRESGGGAHTEPPSALPRELPKARPWAPILLPSIAPPPPIPVARAPVNDSTPIPIPTAAAIAAEAVPPGVELSNGDGAPSAGDIATAGLPMVLPQLILAGAQLEWPKSCAGWLGVLVVAQRTLPLPQSCCRMAIGSVACERGERKCGATVGLWIGGGRFAGAGS